MLGPGHLVLQGLGNRLLGVAHHEGAAEQDSRLVDAVVFVAESTHTAGLHKEGRALLERLADPPHGEGTQDVPVADDEDVAGAVVGGVDVLTRVLLLHERLLVLGADGGDQPVHALRDVLGRLPAGAAVPPDVPALAQALILPQLADLGARDALIVAIVPLADVLGDFYARVAGQAGCVARGAMGVPGEVPEAEVEQLESPLGSLPR